jgi:DEAD/DEAH box helicase domain-containing protein
VEVEILETFDSQPLAHAPPPPEANGRAGKGQEWEARASRAQRAQGRVLVTAQATTYRKVKRYSHEILGYGPIDLPPREMETTAYWLWLDDDTVKALQAQGIMLAPNDYGPNWPQMRNAARARDGYRCRQCGTPEPPSPGPGADPLGGRQHDVHHIRPFREFGYIPGVNDNYLEANALENLITLCQACHHRAETTRGPRTALGGLAHALGNLAPLFLMCDPRDIGVVSELRGSATRLPTITVYDRVPEGIGFSEKLYELHDQLLNAALELVRTCRCRDGCPACVGPAGEGAEVKEKTRQMLETLLA